MKTPLIEEKHSDSTDDTYNLDKTTVYSQRGFLHAARRFGKQSGDSQVELIDDIPEIVNYMVQYLCERNYHLPSEQVPRPWAFQLDWEDIEPGGLRASLSLSQRRYWDEYLWRTSATKMVHVLRNHPPVCPDNPPMVMKLDPDKDDGHAAFRELLGYSDRTEWLEASPLAHPRDDLGIHAQVYALAGKYHIIGLQDLAYERFKQSLALSFTDEHFFEVVHIIYLGSDTRLKKKVAAHLVRTKELYGMYNELKQAIEANHELAYYISREGEGWISWLLRTRSFSNRGRR